MSDIPVAFPRARYEKHRGEIDEAVRRVLERGAYILGPEVEAFEQEFAAWNGSGFAVGVANGTDALILALRERGIGPGDEVITVSHTAVATVAAIVTVGAIPVFCDIEPETRGMDPRLVPALITERTKVVLPVHIYGHPVRIADIAKIAEQHRLTLIEDCAQAHGAMRGGTKVGNFGLSAAFSFYPTKNLGAFGDGGALLTNDAAAAARARELRQYGWRERYISRSHGMNSRLDELHAAVLRVMLRHLDEDNRRRREIAAQYAAALAGSAVVVPVEHADAQHVYHLFVVEDDQRERLQQHLASRRVQSGYHYPAAVHQQPAYAKYLLSGQVLPETERLYRRLLSLPLFPELTDDQVVQVCDALRSYS